MLRLQPENYKCLDWDHIKKVTPKKYRIKVFNAIHKYFTQFLISELFSKLEWLYAIPIMDFLFEQAKPFMCLEYDVGKILWSGNLITSKILKQLKDIEECRYAYLMIHLTFLF